jgi:uncharacterized membrane protein YkoI
MNAKIMLLWLAMGAAGSAYAQERVDVGALPAAVKQTIDRWSSQGPVKAVTRHVVDGRNVYDVQFEKDNAINPRLRISEDGLIISGPSVVLPPAGATAPVVTDEYGGIATPLAPQLKLTDVPAAVQQTARSQAAGREIVDIDRETWKGVAVYEIEFKERGLNSRVYVGEDGKVVRDERRPGQGLKSLFMGTQLEDTPPAVQAAIKRHATDREILDIDRRGTGSALVYRVEIRDGEGRQELRIDGEGKVLYDSRSPASQRG